MIHNKTQNPGSFSTPKRATRERSRSSSQQPPYQDGLPDGMQQHPAAQTTAFMNGADPFATYPDQDADGMQQDPTAPMQMGSGAVPPEEVEQQVSDNFMCQHSFTVYHIYTRIISLFQIKIAIEPYKQALREVFSPLSLRSNISSPTFSQANDALYQAQQINRQSQDTISQFGAERDSLLDQIATLTKKLEEANSHAVEVCSPSVVYK